MSRPRRIISTSPQRSGVRLLLANARARPGWSEDLLRTAAASLRACVLGLRRHRFACQFRSTRGGGSDSSPHDVRRPETRQALAMRADEERTLLLGLEAALAHQCFQRSDEITWEWHDPLFAAFAAQEHVRSRAIEPKVACINSERFGDAGAGSSEEQEQRPVPAATVCLLVRQGSLRWQCWGSRL
jgi:hypothetical protein